MRLIAFLTAFVCAASLLVVGQDDSATGVQSRIVALEKAWNQAYKMGDRKALDALLDDQIVLVNDDGSMQNKAEFLASISPSNSQEQQVTPESITVHVYGRRRQRLGYFEPRASKAASLTCAASVLSTRGFIKMESGDAPPPVQRLSCTEGGSTCFTSIWQ